MKIKNLRDKLELSTLIGIFLLSVMSLAPAANADELVHEFKNPSFAEYVKLS